MKYIFGFIYTVSLSFALLFASAGTAAAQNYYQASGERISQIRVTGVERIDPATVTAYMDVRVGDSMTPRTLDDALKSLFATGLFADVTLHQRGNVLEVNVVENPVINQIAFEGNDKIKNEELLAEIQMRPRQVFTRTRVQSDVNRLYQLYQRGGRFSVNIEPKVIRLDQNRVNLVFEINEGAVTKVKSIRFVGNRKFSDQKLRSEVSTKEQRWYRFLSSDDRYDPDRVSYDEEMLRRFYLSQGYADFTLVSSVAELSSDRRHFHLTFTVNEGERYRVNDVHIRAALRDFDPERLRPHLQVKSGDWYNADRVRSSIDDITDALGDMQYAFVNVRPDIRRNREERTVDVIFQIDEAPRVFVERIDIRGNVRTLDKVLRREMTLAEGDPFNRSRLARSEQRIRNLDFFETVEVTPMRGSMPDRTIVDVEVSEKSTGELSLGAGFSTADGPLADIRLTERNLLGRGQRLNLGATIAGRRTEFDFGYTEPYFLERDLSAGFDVYHMTRDLQRESSYDQRRTGGNLRFGYPLSERWRQSLRYTLHRNDIKNVKDNASRFVKEQEGKRVTSAISQRLTYDSRDSTVFTTSGLHGWFDTEFAGLDGDASYLSGRVGLSYYYPIHDRWVFNLLGETGAITGMRGKNVEINERFFLGGDTLRGFESAGVGPRDISSDDSLGGNYFYRGTAELSFPVGLPEELGVLGHAFTDFGSLWDLDRGGVDVKDVSSLRASAGLGVSWRSPLGPIRMDFSRPYLDESFDKKEVFRFSFGTRF